MTQLGEIKRNRPCNRRWLLRHGALALPFIVAGMPARAAERVGLVEDVKGEAFAEIDAVRRTLERAASVFLGDDVATGVASRLGMRLGRDTMIRLGEEARLKIDRFLVNAGGEMTLRSGPLLFDRPRGSASAGLRIRSLTRHSADAGKAMGARTHPRRTRKRQLSPRGHWKNMPTNEVVLSLLSQTSLFGRTLDRIFCDPGKPVAIGRHGLDG